jgi:hypothetical protein
MGSMALAPQSVKPIEYKTMNVTPFTITSTRHHLRYYDHEKHLFIR